MLPLYNKALAFLLRGGYRATRSMPGFAELEYSGDEPGEREPRLLLWVEDRALPPSASLSEADRAERAKREDALLVHMISEVQATRQCAAYFLAPSRQGLSQNFIQAATRTLQRNRRDGVGGIRVPIEFFDTAYKLDGASGARARASVFSNVIAMAEKRKRVAQPFALRHGFGSGDVTPGAADLVEHLETALMQTPERPILRIIDGPAGSGKSVAFEALAAKVYGEFMAAKQADVLRPRPIVFLPEHIRGHAIGYVDDIIDAMTEDEASSPVEPEQLRFLLTAGHSIWMLDGLDEFFAGDNDFFPFLTEQLASPESRAQIIICTRDSLLSSSTALRGFIEHAWAKGIAVELYEVAPWGEAAWRDLAWLELEHGRKGAQTSATVNGFVSALVASSDLSQLAQLPFYCTVLLEQYRKTKAMPADSLAALDTVLDRMLAREEGKAVFQWRDFVDADVLADLAEGDESAFDKRMFDGRSAKHVIADAFDKAGRESVVEMLGLLAHQRVRLKPRKTADGGIAVTDMTDVLSPVYLPGAEGGEQKHLSTALVQFAFFGAGRRAGVVDFTHPILAEYLAGLYAASVLRRAAHASGGSALSRLAVMKGAVHEAFGDADMVAGSMFERTLSRAVKRDPSLRAFLQSAAGAVSDSKTLSAAVARVG